MNWLSFLLVAVIGLLAWRAYLTGFVRELVSLCAVILAVPIAGLFYDDMYPKVEPIVGNDAAAGIISFLAIFFAVVVAGQVAAHLLRTFVMMLNLGGADRIAGGAFGVLKGVILCQVVLIALVVFPWPDIHEQIHDSRVATELLDIARLPLAILPSEFEAQINAFLDGVDEVVDSAGAPPSPTPQPAPD